MLINGNPMTIIGVAQPGYQGIEVGGATDVFVPVMMKAQVTPTWNALEDRRDCWLQVFARLKPGVSVKKAQAGLEPLYKQILQSEIQTLPADKPKLRDVFLKEKKLAVESATQGRVEPARLGGEAAVRVDEHGGVGASDRLCECRESADSAGCGSAERDRDSAFARGFALADRSPTPA